MMEIVKALIADDEPLLLYHLEKMLSEVWLELEIVAKVSDGNSALEAILKFSPDVVFLDIRMPGLDGISLASKLNRHQSPPEIVFTTAYDEYAVKAFDLSASDYLLKPLNEERLFKACQKIKNRLDNNQASSQDLHSLFGQLNENRTSTPNRLHWIKASLGDEIHLISVDDVAYFKSNDKYVSVYCRQENDKFEEFIIRMSLKELLEQLDPNRFWQIHRSTIISVSAIDKVKKDLGGRMFVIIGCCGLPVSRACQHLFKGM